MTTGYVYKLEVDGCLPYYGSTTQRLKARFAKHRQNARNNKDTLTPSLLFKFGMPTIRLLEQIIFKDKNELFERERFYIENNECVNKIKPLGLNKEEKIKNRQKEYDIANKERIFIQKQQYRLKNAEKIKEKKAQDYEQNKEQLNCKITCDICDIEITARNYYRHIKTKKHQNNITCEIILE